MICSGCKKNNNNIPEFVTDADGNTYKTISIGTQVWLTENLNVSKYRNGASILNITNDMTWGGLDIGAYCNYNNLATSGYGLLYNWHALNDSRGICPTGWHVPSDKEWKTLIDCLGGTDSAGDKLREEGTAHWNNPNFGATNESGFTALPGGQRHFSGGFYGLGESGFWWSSTEWGDICCAYKFGITIYDTSTWLRYHEEESKKAGLSIRCIID